MKNPYIFLVMVFALYVAAMPFAWADVVHGTRIRMSDRTMQPINKLRPQQLISGEHGLKLRVQGVHATRSGAFQVIEIYTINHHLVQVTPGQLVVTANGLIPAAQLRKSHKVITQEGVMSIAHLKRRNYQGKLYSMHVEGEGGQNYFANDILLFQKPSR